MDKLSPQVKKEHYFRQKYDDLNRFISYFYQIDLVRQIAQTKAVDAEGSANYADSKILEVGKGNGIVSDYLKKLGYQVVTADIDPALKPDYIADIRKLPFKDDEFDLAMACEVLEHLPFEEFEKSLAELNRVSRKYVLISLPYRSTGFEMVLKFPGIRTICRKLLLDFFLRIPLKFGGIELSGQHYWEIDGVKFRLSKIRKIIRRQFKIIKEVRPVLNHYHKFFLLEK